MLWDIANGSNDGGLSYHPFKVVAALKSLNLFSSQDVTNVHYFKKELRVKYKATKAICGKFPFGTNILVFVMVNFPGGGHDNDFTTFYNMTPSNQAVWEMIYGNLMLAMLFLDNVRNEETKKDLCHSYANGNANAYQITLEKLARLSSS